MDKKMMEAIDNDLREQRTSPARFSDRLKDYYMLVDRGYAKYDKRVLEYPAGHQPQFFSVDRSKRSTNCDCCGAPKSDPMQGSAACFYCGSCLTPG